MRCENCGLENDAGAIFCRGCGSRLGSAVTPTAPAAPAALCRSCGAENDPGMSFCWNCGQPVSGPIASAPAPPAGPAVPPGTPAQRRSSVGALPFILVAVLLVSAGAFAGVYWFTQIRAKAPAAPTTDGISASSTPTGAASSDGTSAADAATATGRAGGGPSGDAATGPAVDLSGSASLTASSYLRNSADYRVENLVDGRTDTCWAEGVKGFGVGEWFDFDFGSQVTVSQLQVVAGYDKIKNGWDRWYTNGRAKRIRVSFSDGTSTDFDLTDSRPVQTIRITPPRQTTSVRVTLVGCYPAQAGPHYAEDTSLSESHVYGTR